MSVRDAADFLHQIDTHGCVLVEAVLDDGLVKKLKAALRNAIDGEAKYHGSESYADYAMVQCCAMYDRIFVDILDMEPLMGPLELVLGKGSIIYAYTSSSLPPKASNFAQRIHVDCPRLIPGYLTNFGAVVLLDDFTEENGATWYLPGSHTRPEAPPEREFYRSARRLIAPAGSVWFMNPRVWHAAGTNTTDQWRHSFGLNVCRPFIKQRFDLPRLLRNVDLEGLSDRARQKLGFFAQPPASLDEYYAPPDQRTFRQPYE